MNGTYDLKTNLGGDVSHAASLSGASASNGDGVDCSTLVGPIEGIFQSGAATGTPDSYTVACKLQESDASGSGYADIGVQETMTISGDKQLKVVRGIRTKRYVRAVATPTFVNGTSPEVYVMGSVVGQLQYA